MTSNEQDPSAAEVPMTYDELLDEVQVNTKDYMVLDGADVQTPPEELVVGPHGSGLHLVSERWKISTVHSAAEVQGISEADAAGLGITPDSELTFSYSPQCISQDDEGVQKYEPIVSTVQIRQPGDTQAVRYMVTQSLVPGSEYVVGEKRTVNLNSAESLMEQADSHDETVRDAGLRALDKLMDAAVGSGDALSDWLAEGQAPGVRIPEDELAHLSSLLYDVYAARRDAAPDTDTQS